MAATRSHSDWNASAHRSWAFRLWWMMALTAAAWCLLAGIASAQKYDTYEFDKKYEVFKEPKKAAELERATSQLKTARDLDKIDKSAPNYAKFYLTEYIPWKLTQKENLAEVSSTIEDLLKDLDGAQRMSSAGARTLLINTFFGMQRIAEGNYIPAARINAINALARLNATPLDIANGRPPLPLKQSYPILFKLYANEKENDGVRAAALHGIHHYTQFAFPVMTAEEKKALVDEMNKLLAAEPPQSRDPEAHAYLQRFAVDILNILRAPNDESLGTQLISISTSETHPDLIALYSASKLGGINSGLQGKVKDPAEVTKQWSLRAFNAIESELARFAAQTPPKKAMQQPPNPITFLQKSETAKERAKRQRAASSGRGAGGSGMDAEYGSMGGEYDSMEGMGSMDMMDSSYGEMSGYGDMEMMGSGMMMMPQIPPQPPEVNLSRRKVSLVLQQLLRGATGSPKGKIGEKPSGLMAGVDQADQAVIQEWVATMLEVVAALNEESLSDLEKWTDALESQRPILGALAGVEVTAIEDPDEIEDRPLLPFPGMAAPMEPAAEANALPGLPVAQ
ncbi:hypothetical protein [Allorhodopirellula heiligendammensis]|uniref:hypothetical protein n=1 Tax=Allorhodopirellula heiligendammensis TaxID=2714739 RepID=UPI00265F2497|nr:hypothetical protein [Allorhodopirellula heiligendammensis]